MSICFIPIGLAIFLTEAISLLSNDFASATPVVRKELDVEHLIVALMMQESGGEGEDAPYTIGDNGRAYGCLQVHQLTLTDVNQKLDTDHELEDLLGNIDLSKEVCRVYLAIYADDDPTYEELARLWNGGPEWREKPHTKAYWQSARQFL